MTNKREAMRFAPATPAPAETPPSPPRKRELVKLGTSIPKDLDTWLNIEAARRDVTKQDLIIAIFEGYRAAHE
jgi:hypothetical protein